LKRRVIEFIKAGASWHPAFHICARTAPHPAPGTGSGPFLMPLSFADLERPSAFREPTRICSAYIRAYPSGTLIRNSSYNAPLFYRPCAWSFRSDFARSSDLRFSSIGPAPRCYVIPCQRDVNKISMKSGRIIPLILEDNTTWAYYWTIEKAWGTCSAALHTFLAEGESCGDTGLHNYYSTKDPKGFPPLCSGPS